MVVDADDPPPVVPLPALPRAPPERLSLRPRPGRPVPTGGIEAALEERRHFKAAGMLDVWRERWKAILRPG